MSNIGAACYTLPVLGDDKPLRELDDTAGSAADDRFEEILKRFKQLGAEITRDDTTPLFIDFNNDEVQIGDTRVVEFNVNRMEFRITRNVKRKRIAGSDSHRKHLEDVVRPIIELKLKRKPDTSDQWEAVDLEDVF